MVSKIKQIRTPLTLTRLLPNIITLLALIIGVSAIRFALEGKWEAAVVCTIIASFLDGLDGRLARILNATSVFGAQLDSLCDFVNFGLSPALIMYLWSFRYSPYKLLAWAAVIVYIICAAIRLARFNTGIFKDDYKSPENEREKYFFTGMPVTSSALLAIIPIMLEFELADIINLDPKAYSLASMLYLSFIGFLMASRTPTFSIKHISIKPEFIWISLLLSGAIVILVILYPWHCIPLIGILYLCSVPISIMSAKRIN